MPDPADSPPGEDLVAVGADLEPGTLLAAYRAGLFPMPLDPHRRRSKIGWFSPDPRGVLPLDGLRVSKSLRRSRRRYEVRVDAAFREVMTRCGDPEREGRWITAPFVDAYTRLFDMGWAHSFEAWNDGELVGGLYGLRVGRFFAGEAMFHTATDASKVALVELVEWLRETERRVARRPMGHATPHVARRRGDSAARVPPSSRSSHPRRVTAPKTAATERWHLWHRSVVVLAGRIRHPTGLVPAMGNLSGRFRPGEEPEPSGRSGVLRCFAATHSSSSRPGAGLEQFF